MPPIKIISYNVNGIRAALKKDLTTWLQAANPDVLCLQETKATPDQVDLTEIESLGYQHYWESAEKKGYSGVAIFTKTTPDHIEYGCGLPVYDREGRVIRADYGDLSVLSVYMPSGSRSDERQAFKMQWLDDFQRYINELKITRPNLVISGDYNICHKPIDIHNPIRNANTSGFKPDERAWVGEFIESGFIDSFRHFDESADRYTWWTYRAGARARNLGWRIDYHMVSEPLRDRLVDARILSKAMHSDHCPIVVELAG